MTTIIRPGQRVLNVPGIGMRVSRRAVSVGGASTIFDGMVEYLPLSEASDGSGSVRRVGLHRGMKFTDAGNVISGTGHVYGTCAEYALDATDYIWRDDYRLQFDSDFTVAAWVRFTGSDVDYRGIVEAAASTKGYSLFINLSNQLVSNIYRNAGGAGETNLHNAALSADTWYLVRMWYDSTAQVHCNQINLTTPVSEARTEIFRSIGTIRVGMYQGNKPWRGQIGPVMWWNRVLTDAEWSELYNGGAGAVYVSTAIAVPWKPTDITGCALWLAADDMNGNGDLNTDWTTSDAVAAWPDLSGNSRTVSQTAAAAKPVFQKNTINTYMPVLDFQGNDYLLSNANLIGGTAGTVFAVVKSRATAPAAYQAVFSAADEASSNRYVFVGPYLDAGNPGIYSYQRDNDTADRLHGSALATNTAYVMMWQSNGSAYAFRSNGADETEVVTSGANNGDWIDDVTGVDNFTVGAVKYNALFFYLNMNLAELIVYDSALSAENIALVEAYLAAKWGITLP